MGLASVLLWLDAVVVNRLLLNEKGCTQQNMKNPRYRLINRKAGYNNPAFLYPGLFILSLLTLVS
jgi:hypothetical protein